MLVSSFFNKELNSLTFYKNINVHVIEDNLEWLYTRMFDRESLYSNDTIDFLTYLLLLNFTQQAGLANEDFYALSKSYSEKYFELINTEDVNVELKLKCQRLNYLIQLHLDKSKAQFQGAAFLDDNVYFYPWDIETIEGGLIVVESRDTVRYNNEVVDYLSQENMMFTQVDQCNGKLLFNSCYSQYTAFVDFKAEESEIRKDDKCLFMFFYRGLLSKVTSEGDVLIGENKIGYLGESNKPWRFRVFENSLFVFDWFEFGSCVIFDLEAGLTRRYTFEEMWIPHDVVRKNDNYYFLDKQQGMIFIYDLDFRFVNSLLTFGYDKGQLCDPIGIKKNGEALVVSSWLSGVINSVHV